jgi:MYXO-CTERM domain-containing protein
MWKQAVLGLAALAALPSQAHAFCGFYVSGSGAQLVNDATQVVMMRMGTRTVLSMQNDYKGPPEAFAMVIPVPVVLHEKDVKTLTKDVFAHVEQMGAPRLVEYWEQDPCKSEPDYAMAPTSVTRAAMLTPSPAGKAGLGVTIEAQFTVGEYQIVILSAKDSTGLDTWLRQEKYQIPAGAEPLLRPYVESGSKFFVAKVDPQKVKFEDGRVALSPLRFHYDAEDFTLPIRLGLANSGGTQDLIVSILAPGQRYEMANYPNVTVPTNLEVKDLVRDRFGEFYAALFDRTLQQHPGAVVTEYAWQASTCDPCPGPQLGPADFATLGADVLAGGSGVAQPYQGYDFVLTRLHARYGKDLKDDLVFKAATPIVGGREFLRSDGQLEDGAQAAGTNNFQARYAIRHRWQGSITCDQPQRGRWGGPWPEIAAKPDFSGGGVKGATNLAFAKRGALQLAAAVHRDVPELGLKAGETSASTPTADSGSAASQGSATDAPAPSPTKKRGCGCQTASGGDAAGLGLLVLLGIGLRRPRRRA